MKYIYVMYIWNYPLRVAYTTYMYVLDDVQVSKRLTRCTKDPHEAAEHGAHIRKGCITKRNRAHNFRHACPPQQHPTSQTSHSISIHKNITQTPSKLCVLY